MTHGPSRHDRSGPFWRPALLLPTLVLALTSLAYAGPGAHGANGEHLDAPDTANPVAASAAPHLEAHSEDFELVATLGGGELSVWVDRFETNEPVLRATLEVESGGLKATARFHADQGDYAIDDAKLLAELAKPGSHPLVFTVVAGEESDLLEGVLVVARGQEREHDADRGHGHGVGRRAAAIVAVFTALALSGWWVARRRARRLSSPVSSSVLISKDA